MKSVEGLRINPDNMGLRRRIEELRKSVETMTKLDK